MKRCSPSAIVLLAAGLLLAAGDVKALTPQVLNPGEPGARVLSPTDPLTQETRPGRTVWGATATESQAGSGAASYGDYEAARPGAVDPGMAALEAAFKRQAQRAAMGPPPPPAGTAPERSYYLWMGVFLLAGALILRKLDSFLHRFQVWNSMWNAVASALTPQQMRMAEDPKMAAFLKELQFALQGEFPEPDAAPPGMAAPQTGGNPGADARLVEKLRAAASGRVGELRPLLRRAGQECDDTARSAILLEFSQGMDELKKQSHLPELLPIWLMACALEGISRQASINISRYTPSVRRTAAAGLDLLETLCLTRLVPRVATNPPIRILGVDDNAICLRALLLALKQVFNEPDLARRGESALALAEKQAYDVIFLDVEMPGMGGFKLCPKILETAANRNTPVVFVTSHSDFDSRAKAADVGGQDLIAKPYLPSEIAVKALTLAMRGRLQNSALAPAVPAPQPLPRNGPSPVPDECLPVTPRDGVLATGASAAPC